MGDVHRKSTNDTWSTKVSDADISPVGYGQDTSFATASALPSIPASAKIAIIQATGDSLYWRDDGTDPTTSVGMLLAAGDSFLYTGDLSAIKIIESSTSSVVNVSYYA